MINRMYKFKSTISPEQKSEKIKEIKEIIKRYPELNRNTSAYFEDDGTYVISVFEPTFIEKLRGSYKKGNMTPHSSRLYGNYQDRNSQKGYNNYR